MQPTWPPPAWAPTPAPAPAPAGPRETAAPVAESERRVAIDALRAVALLGIVVVNVAAYRRGVGPILAAAGGDVGGDVSPLTVVLSALTEGRFYPLFSFLFGWGFAVQDARSRARGRSVTGPWLRRCLVLLVLGLLHATFLFDGDILVTYAVIGVALLLVRRVPPSWLAGLGAGLVVLQSLFTTGLVALSASITLSAESAGSIAEVRADERARLAADATVYARGSFGDVIRLRTEDLAFEEFLGLLTVGGTVAGMMLLGMAAARVGWVDPRRWPAWLRSAMVPAWAIGLVLSIPAAWLSGSIALGSDLPGEAALRWLGYSLLGPAVALTWAGVVLLAARTALGGRVLGAIAPAGRMSLTLYLSQSLVASLVFNGYGLGLGDDVGIGGAVALVAVLWAVQVALAALWFRFFAIGPLEAGTRAVAYLRWPGLRRQR
ncbi:MAG TPA: DUF418 domain-containing protein [Iamia sp.]|nr:DUF418 domain-containing protein [Iamia sp.]